MRGWLVVLCACNQALDLHATYLAPPDALPTSCPPIGTAPRFSGTFHQVVAQTCTDYSPSFETATVLARCLDAASFGVFGGTIDQPVTRLDFGTVAATAALEQPRLAPEGDYALVDNTAFDSIAGDEIAAYQRVDASTWKLLGDAGLPRGPVVFVGSMTRGPHHHVMWIGGLGIQEYVHQDNGTWLEVPTTAALPSNPLGSASLTSDGLRLVVPTLTAIYYADRASIDDAFGAAVPLEGVPSGASQPVLAPDCTRLYFSGQATEIDRVFFVEQI